MQRENVLGTDLRQMAGNKLRRLSRPEKSRIIIADAWDAERSSE